MYMYMFIHVGISNTCTCICTYMWVLVIHVHVYVSLFILEESHLDPNDPRNFELLDLAKVTTPTCHTHSLMSCSLSHQNVSSAPTNEYFRLQAMDSVERFVSDHQFTSDKRFTLLQLREQRVSDSVTIYSVVLCDYL